MFPNHPIDASTIQHRLNTVLKCLKGTFYHTIMLSGREGSEISIYPQQKPFLLLLEILILYFYITSYIVNMDAIMSNVFTNKIIFSLNSLSSFNKNYRYISQIHQYHITNILSTITFNVNTTKVKVNTFTNGHKRFLYTYQRLTLRDLSM